MNHFQSLFITPEFISGCFEKMFVVKVCWKSLADRLLQEFAMFSFVDIDVRS